jgi:hypothetical protein
VQKPIILDINYALLSRRLCEKGLGVNKINPHHIKCATKEIAEKPDVSHLNPTYFEGKEKQHDAIANCKVEWNKLKSSKCRLIENLPD